MSTIQKNCRIHENKKVTPEQRLESFKISLISNQVSLPSRPFKIASFPLLEWRKGFVLGEMSSLTISCHQESIANIHSMIGYVGICKCIWGHSPTSAWYDIKRVLFTDSIWFSIVDQSRVQEIRNQMRTREYPAQIFKICLHSWNISSITSKLLQIWPLFLSFSSNSGQN